MTTTTVPAQQLLELRTKLTNLVTNAEDRLSDETADRQYVLEGVLDRLAELATGLLPKPSAHIHPTREAAPCVLCGRFTASVRVTAGNPGTDQYRDVAVCTHCTLPAVTAAAPAGEVHVHPITRGGTTYVH
jgi:hypothetical protein